MENHQEAQTTAAPNEGQKITADNIRNRELNSFISEVKDDKTRNYITNRVVSQMDYYSKASRKNKKKFYQYMTASIILGAAIPVITVLADENLWTGFPLLGVRFVITLLGASVTGINAYLALNNYKDLWLTYRDTRENLLRTLYFYFNNVEDFEKGTQAEKDALLIRVCEKELAKENGGWRMLAEKIDASPRN